VIEKRNTDVIRIRIIPQAGIEGDIREHIGIPHPVYGAAPVLGSRFLTQAVKTIPCFPLPRYAPSSIQVSICPPLDRPENCTTLGTINLYRKRPAAHCHMKRLRIEQYLTGIIPHGKRNRAEIVIHYRQGGMLFEFSSLGDFETDYIRADELHSHPLIIDREFDSSPGLHDFADRVYRKKKMGFDIILKTGLNWHGTPSPESLQSLY
jgi:hypothetical protein